MARNISFALTTEQIKKKEKTITRRFGWWFLKPGDKLRGVEKAMGLKKGEKIVPLCMIKVVSTRAEPLNAITKDDCRREGFPDMDPHEFISMIQEHYKCSADAVINRIEFEYV